MWSLNRLEEGARVKIVVGMVKMGNRLSEREKIWEEEAGYMTVEASFLVTFVFLILFTVMLAGLYVCDLNQAKSFLNQRVTELSVKEENYAASLLAQDRSRIKEMLFVTKLSDFNITVTEKEVSGRMKLSMNVNVPLIGDWVGRFWTNEISLKVDRGNNTEIMRRWEWFE